MNQTNTNATIDRNVYGAKETQGLVNGDAYHAQERKQTVEWTEPGLTITRLRLLSDPSFPVWDVSYCHGTLADGTLVLVILPFSQLPKRDMMAAIIKYAKADGNLYAKGTGIFAAISTLQ